MLATTDRISHVHLAGIPIGLVLVLIHLVGIPVDNTSVNSARSIGPAIFVGGWALEQLWLFIVAPLIGVLVGAGLHMFLFGRREATPEGETGVAGASTERDPPERQGSRTFGKALVQTTRLLADGGALKPTTARHLTPRGTDIAHRGLQPDVRVTDDPATARDKPLERALALVTATHRRPAAAGRAGLRPGGPPSAPARPFGR